MPTVEEYGATLKSHPAAPTDCRLTRVIPFLSYQGSADPSFLYTSGRPNRCNPAGVNCIYLSEDRDTAQAEFDVHNEDPTAPSLTYHGRLKAAVIVDLALPAQRKKFRIPARDFIDNFRFRELDLQRLGRAMAAQNRAVAIRYPSRAMQEQGKIGNNFAIFPDAITPPDALVIYGGNGKVLERWPKP